MAKCPECRGRIKFNSRDNLYICKQCGLVLTREEYARVMSEERNLDLEETDHSREYLDWWLSDKKR